MRFVTMFLALIIGVGTYHLSLSRHDFTGVLWESHEVIMTQNVDVGTKEDARFNSVNTYITIMYLSDGKFTASITAVVDYKNGLEEVVTQEFTGNWIKQGQYLDMRIENYHSIVGDPSDKTLIERIQYYARIELYQTYILQYYKGRLILTSSHAGGPVLTLSKRSN